MSSEKVIAISAEAVECGKRVSEYLVLLTLVPRRNSSGSSKSPPKSIISK